MKRFFARLRCLMELPLLPVWLGPVILFAPVWATGQALYWGTVSLQFVPWRLWAWEMIRAGQMPLWNPLVGLGAPLAANYQSALFYPPNWIPFLFEVAGGTGWMAWSNTWLVIFHLILAGMGMVVLGRRMGLSPLGQMVMALAFELSGYLVTRAGFFSINATVAWMPWLLAYGWDVVREEKGSYGPFIRLTACMALMLLAGHAQTAAYALVLMGAWVLFQGRGKGVFRIAAAGAAAVLTAMVQLWPTYEYLQQSQRSDAVDFAFAVNYSFHPMRFLTLLAPNLFGSPAAGSYLLKADNYWEGAIYVGLLPLLLGVIFLVVVLRRRPKSTCLVCFLVEVWLVSFALALGSNTPIFPFLYHTVPGFDMFQAPTRFSLWGVWAMAVMGGLAVDALHRPVKKALFWTRLATMGGFALTVGAGAGWLILGAKAELVLGVAWAGLMALGVGLLMLFKPEGEAGEKAIPARLWPWLVSGLLMLDLISASWGFHMGTAVEVYAWKPGGSAERIWMETETERFLKFDRFFEFTNFKSNPDMTKMRAACLPNICMLDGVSLVNNFDPLVPGRMAKWMALLETGQPATRRRMLEMMAVNTIAILEPGGEVIRAEFEEREKIAWADCIEGVPDEASAWEKISAYLNEPESMPGNIALLEGYDGPKHCEPGSKGETTLIRAVPGEESYQVSNSKPGWLVIANSWYPGWEAWLDGHKVELYRANYVEMAVEIKDSGNHSLVLTYKPLSVYGGAAISLFTIAGLMCLGIFSGYGRIKPLRIQ
ncbi:MAG TPA: hypothetical protein PKW33_01870 [Anaerolineaceae bacterium]|nr:hypothetical protein [Anaerolineaceae bacterium]HPN50306.1 hypothetical protein [Anaerolineaceae bacterium]